MAKVIYLISYDLQMYTKPEIWDNEYKIYNREKGMFEELPKKPDFIDANTLEVGIEIIKNLTRDMIYSEYGVLLDKDKMKWYLSFERELEKRPELLKNKELLFNYIVLKAELAGMPNNIAMLIYGHYFSQLEKDDTDLVSYDSILDSLNELKDNKKYWVPPLDEEMKKEIMVVDDIIHSRASSAHYSFDQFEARYLKICNEGYIRKIMNYNLNSENLYSHGYTLEEQKEFLLRFFEHTTTDLIEQISDSYEYFKGNFASKKMLFENMKRTLEYAMKFW